jgi:hypothetical protein
VSHAPGGDAARAAVTRIKKRDGREVPFDGAKIARAIEHALAAAGEPDARFAAEVAAVVELELRRGAEERALRREGEYVPAIEEIQDLVERALIELGRAGAAKAYILYRERRAQVRAVLQVREERTSGVPRVQATHQMSSWSKARISAALIEEALLPRATAEDVARRVELRVIELGLRRISSGLVRELVDIELVELGLTHALRRQEALKLPRHDLRRLLSGQGGEPWRAGRAPTLRDVEPIVGQRIVSRYALEDLLDEEVAELHLDGDLHIEALGQAQQPAWIGAPAALLASGPDSADTPFEALGELSRWLRSAGSGVVIEDCGALLAPLLRAPRGASAPTALLSSWWRAVDALAAGCDRRIELVGLATRSGASGARAGGASANFGGAGTRNAALSARLIEWLAVQSAPSRVRLYLEAEELEALLAEGSEHAAAVERVLASGRLVPLFGEGPTRLCGSAGPRYARGGAQGQGWVGSATRIAVHLPRLARRAGPWREDAFFAGLAALVPKVLSAARALSSFQREVAEAAGSVGTPRIQPSAALVPVGLSEALSVLGGGEIDPAQGARTLGLLSEAATRFLRPGDCPLHVSTLGSLEAAQRFAWLDALLARGQGFTQGELFPLVEESRAARVSPGLALRVGPAWKPGEAEAELYAALPYGALEAPGDTASDALPALDRWRRFRARRARSRGTDHGLLFPLGLRGASSERAEGGANSLDSSARSLDNPAAHAENS